MTDRDHSEGSFGDRYEPLERIESGPCPRYRARDHSLDREVVVRLLPSELEDDLRAALLARFRAAAKVDHPALAAIHEIGADDRGDWIAYEQIEGRRLDAPAGDEPARPVELGQALSEVLAQLHAAGVDHGGLDASDVVVTGAGYARLAEPIHVGGSPLEPLPELGSAAGRQRDVRDLGRLLAAATAATPQVLDLARRAAAGELDLAAVQAALATAAQRRPAPWKVPLLVGAAIAGFLALNAHFLLQRSSPAPEQSSAGVKSGRLAIARFVEVSGASDDDGGIAGVIRSLVATELASTGQLSIVGDQRLHDVSVRLGHPGLPSALDAARAVAREVGASTLLVGGLESDPPLAVRGRLIDVATGRELAVRRASAGSERDVFALAATLARALAREVVGHTAVLDPMERVTDSLEAYRAFVRGEAHFHRSDFEASATELRRALQLDPDFALARYRLSIVATWTGDQAEALAQAVAASERMRQLPANYRDIVRANLFYVRGQLGDAVPYLQEALAFDPDSQEALLLLSEVYMHSAIHADPSRSAEMMERLLALNPQYHLVYNHLAWAYAFAGDFAAAHERLALWEEEQPSIVEETRAVVHAFEGDPERCVTAMEAIAEGGTELHRGMCAMAAGRWQLADRLTAHEFEGGYLAAWGNRNRGHFLAHQGRFREARERYLAAAAIGADGDGPPREDLASGLRSSALMSLAELEDLLGRPGAARTHLDRALTIQPDHPRTLYVAAFHAITAGDEAAAAAHETRLGELAANARGPAPALYRDALAAERLLATGQPAEAATQYEQVLERGQTRNDWFASSSAPGAILRDRLALCYRTAGRDALEVAALRALIDDPVERVDHPALYGRALHRLAELLRAAGDETGASAVAATLVELWRDADEELPFTVHAQTARQ